jgi:methionine-gamma-lyase
MNDVKAPGKKSAPETFLVHGNPRDEQWNYEYHVIPPITASTTFRLDSCDRGAQGFATFSSPAVTEPGQKPIYIYDRLAEPTVALLENSFKELEKGPSATAFGSGMAAISGSLLALCKQGHEIISHRTIYGCTYSLLTNWLPRLGITTDFADLTDLAAVEPLIRPTTRVIYFETPANPTLDIIDIAAVAQLIAQANEGRSEEDRIYMVVDNTFATPYCQRPREQGADVVVHSLTKNVMGFGTDMGGMVVAPIELHEMIRLARKDFGGVEAPRAAWNILVYGLSSLAIRMDKQIANADEVSRYLANRPEVSRIAYPGLKSHPHHELAKRQMRDFKDRFAPGLMIYFELDGGCDDAGYKRAKAFMDYIARESYVLTLAVSLGQAKTLIEAPALMTHSVYGEKASTAGMSFGAVRLSMGIEEAADIIRDLEAAFNHIQGM